MRYSDDEYPPPGGDEDYLRRRPERQYGSSEQGYSGIPAHARNRRQRELTGGRYGNTAERLPRDETREVEAEESGRYGEYAEPWRYPARGPGDERYEDEWSRRRSMSGGGYGGWREVPRGEYGGGYGGEYGHEYGREYGRYAPPEWDRPEAGWQRRPGPKNYRRDDDRLHDEVCNRLAHEQALDVSEVSVRVQDGVVTLEGSVTDRRDKYEIEEMAERVFGVQDVINHIRVQPFGILASE
ncbi:BON domain-containing protein [Cupriavidus necator]|uniref:BON domain-containing protein n=1 Tax=Cupriavidus necator TaxID=106590 RepID=UPI00339D363B